VNGKRVLLTGGTGFVGANLCRRLVQEGHSVSCLVRPEYDPWRMTDIEDHIQIHVVELEDKAGLERAVGYIRPEWVFHLAAYGAYSWQTELESAVRTNVIGTINLIEACLRSGFEVFVNTGSSSEYGFKDHAPSPKEWIDPNSLYAVTKASATLYCRYTAQRRGARIPTLRLYSVYGPFEDRRRLIPSVIMRGREGRLPPLVSGDVARDYVHVRDVEEAFLRVARDKVGAAGEVFNVGTGTQTTIAQVVQLASEYFDLHAEPDWGTMPNREWDTTIWKADNKTLLATGWKPAMSFPEGFRRTAAWFESTGSLLEHYLQG
jgi:nucleoside-diphosphate-sugar epimerase